MPNIMRNITEITRLGAQYRGDAFAPMGLKAFHGSYLLNICANPGISQEQLAKNICINKSNVARQIVVLEEGGFVERRSSQEDKRVMELYPTAKTLELLPELRKVLGGWSRYLTQDFTEQEIELLGRMLSSMRERAAQWMEEN